MTKLYDRVSAEQALDIEKKLKQDITNHSLIHFAIWGVLGFFAVHRLVLKRDVKKQLLSIVATILLFTGAHLLKSELLAVLGSLTFFYNACYFIFDGISIEDWVHRKVAAERKEIYSKL